MIKRVHLLLLFLLSLREVLVVFVRESRYQIKIFTYYIMKIKRNQVIIAVVVAIVGFLLVNRFMQKPKAVPAAPAALVVAADLKDMKYQIVNSSRSEMYRSEKNTSQTIAVTVLEQFIDILVAVLERPEVTSFANKIVKSKDDADNIALMIEAIGKDAATSITNLSEEQVAKGPDSTYKVLGEQMRTSLKDEVDKSDIWYPIAQRFVAAHGSKQPFKMEDGFKNKVKNASPSEKEQARDELKKLIDEDFGYNSRGRTVDQRTTGDIVANFDQKLGAPPGTRA
jgi:hypothetical protein